MVLDNLKIMHKAVYDGISQGIEHVVSLKYDDNVLPKEKFTPKCDNNSCQELGYQKPYTIAYTAGSMFSQIVTSLIIDLPTLGFYIKKSQKVNSSLLEKKP